MSVRVSIVDGPVVSGEPRPEAPAGRAGAVLTFEGVVREMENGRALAALEYEVYEPMATRQLILLAERAVAGHGVVGLSVVHSRGRVPVGCVSLRVVVSARHRAEGLAVLVEFVDALKRDAPIWKSPVWA